MRRFPVAVCLTIGLTTMSTRAADPGPRPESLSAVSTAETATAEVTEPVIPKRELEFDVSEEQYPLPLVVRGDYSLEQLIEQNYVAQFTLVATEQPEYYRQSGEWTFTSPHFDGSPTDGGDGASLELLHNRLFRGGRSLDPAVFTQLLSRMPQERRPAEDVVKLLTTNPSLFVRISPTMKGVPPGLPERSIWHCDIEVLAPTTQRVRQVAEELLVLLDFGYFLPFQHECIHGKQAFAKDALSLRAELKQLREDVADGQKELEGLKGYDDISKETVAEFTAQIRLISVEMAGAQARLDACDKILADHLGDSPTPRVEQVETLKITAEIELVGLAARKAALDAIAKKGQRRNELVRKTMSASRSIANTERNLARAEEGVNHYEAQRLRVVPYPVKDGKVTIRRIKWESSE